MTQHKIRTLPDGTRVYSNGTRYKPKAASERVYRVRRPDDPRAVRFRGEWYLPLEVLPDNERVMPRSRPDEDGFDHRVMCRCEICLDNEPLLRRKQRDLGVTPGSAPPGRATPRLAGPRPRAAGTAG